MSIHLSNNVTIDTLRSLDAGKSYYLANSTGEIKEAGVWQKFKCFFGFGDGRDKVQRLVDEVKSALLASAGESQNDALAADIDQYVDSRNWSFSASGRSLAALANRFAVANADKIASTEAKALCEREIEKFVRETLIPCLTSKDQIPGAVRYLERAVKPLLENPPMKDSPGGRRVLDEAAFAKTLEKRLDETSNELVQILNTRRLGVNRFDMTYLDHVFKTLYDANGARNDKTLDDLENAFDVRFTVACEESPNKERRPVEHAEFNDIVTTLLKKYENEPDVLDYFLDYIHNNIFKSGGGMRPIEEVDARLSGIRENFRELREAAKGTDNQKGILLIGQKMLRGLRGKPAPAGTIARIAQLAKTADLGLLEKLSPVNAYVDDIHKAVAQLRDALDRIFRETGLDHLDEAENLLQYRSIATVFLLGRFPPDVLKRINATLGTKAAAALARDYNEFAMGNFLAEKDWPVPSWGPKAVDQIEHQFKRLSPILDTFKGILDEMLGMKSQYIDSDRVKGVKATQDDLAVFEDIVLYAKKEAEA